MFLNQMKFSWFENPFSDHFVSPHLILSHFAILTFQLSNNSISERNDSLQYSYFWLRGSEAQAFIASIPWFNCFQLNLYRFEEWKKKDTRGEQWICWMLKAEREHKLMVVFAFDRIDPLNFFPFFVLFFGFAFCSCSLSLLILNINKNQNTINK